MKRAAYTFWSLALALAAGAAFGQRAVTTKSGLRISDQSFGPEKWTHGTIEHRFLIENPSAFRRTVTLELPGERYASWQRGIGLLAGTVDIEAGGRATLSLVQPPLGVDGDSKFAVSEKGQKRETFFCQAKDFQGYSYEDSVSVLLSKSLSAEALSERIAACVSSEGGRRPPVGRRIRRPSPAGTVGALRLERDPSTWPASWLAYAAFDGCLLEASDYARMPEEVRAALRAYVAAGGAVTFLGAPAAPPGWCDPGEKWKPVTGETGLSEAAFGFGRVQVANAPSLSGLASNQVVALASVWAERKAPWSTDSHGYNGATYPFERCLAEIPVEGGSKVPVNLFLFTLLAFAVVAGPGAVLFAARGNRRIWLLAAVPALSLLFSVAIFAAALVAEGVTPYLRRQAVTLLDQTRRQAATLGALAVYAPTTLGRGLGFDRGTEVSPLSYSTSQDFKSIVWGRDQLFSDGWVRPRMASFFRLRRSEERAERLVVTERGNGEVEIVNALGAPVRRLLLCDGRGLLYRAEGVGPGEKRLLSSQEERPAAPAESDAVSGARALFQSGGLGWGLAQTLSGKAALQTPGARSYVAELDGCPFLENPLQGRKVKEQALALVAGRY